MNPPSYDQPVPRGRAFLGTDRFEVRAQIGQGATGTVYRVYDRELDGEVALKTMRRPGPDAVLRMKQEFRSRAGIVHPNLVQLHELFVTDDLCFFTMELIEGDNFLQWARQEVGVPASTRSLASGTATSRIGERPHLPVSTTESVDAADATAGGPVSLEIELAPPIAVPERAWDRLRHAFAELVSGLDV